MDNSTQRVTPAPDHGLANGAPTRDLTGQTLGDFRILRRLGEGGMGQVYLAEQRSLKRPIALKILRAELADNVKALARFKTEAEAVARATHPNIVQVYSIGDHDGVHYMALEYVEGLNLRDFVAKKGPPPVPLALSIMRQGASALQCAAELGIIHRDIKPDNILVTRKGAVKVADFGLSRIAGDGPALNLTQSGVAMGTPLYMSPEQVEGKSLDSRTDIYSFGVTCYHMLAGHPPFRGQTAFEVALQHVQTEPEPLEQIRPDLPAELCGVVRKMMAKQPDQRYATARDVLRELARLRQGMTAEITSQNLLPAPTSPDVSDLVPTIGTPVVSVLPRSGLADLRSRVAAGSTRKRRLIALAAIVLALGGGAWAGIHFRSEDPPEPNGEPSEKLAATDFRIYPRGHGFREKNLKELIDELKQPKDQQEKHTGLRYCIDLGTLYLDQWRLDDADQFFTSLVEIQPRVAEYAIFGRLGHAIVLAFPREKVGAGERYVESTQILVELFNRREFARIRQDLNSSPGFMQKFVQALDYNAQNYKDANKPFPQVLEDVRTKRQPLRPNAPRGNNAKANNKQLT